jgi:hypothetical protein
VLLCYVLLRALYLHGSPFHTGFCMSELRVMCPLAFPMPVHIEKGGLCLLRALMLLRGCLMHFALRHVCLSFPHLFLTPFSLSIAAMPEFNLAQPQQQSQEHAMIHTGGYRRTGSHASSRQAN